MLLNRNGASMEIDGKIFTVGMYVCGTSESEYEGVYGEIIEIRDGDDKDTDNEGTDIICEFYVPDNPKMVSEFENRFSDLYQAPKSIDDIGLDYVIMAADMLRPVKHCRIYQIENAGSEFAFQEFSSLKQKGFASPPEEIYEMVFMGELPTDNLEDIFKIFNCEHPSGYQGRSLSVSDIVELYDETDRTFFYCDTVEFVTIPPILVPLKVLPAKIQENEFQYEPETTIENHCPICGSNKMDYFTYDVQDNMVIYPWKCLNCKATGEEFGRIVFDGYSVDRISLPKTIEEKILGWCHDVNPE